MLTDPSLRFTTSYMSMEQHDQLKDVQSLLSTLWRVLDHFKLENEVVPRDKLVQPITYWPLEWGVVELPSGSLDNGLCINIAEHHLLIEWRA